MIAFLRTRWRGSRRSCWPGWRRISRCCVTPRACCACTSTQRGSSGTGPILTAPTEELHQMRACISARNVSVVLKRDLQSRVVNVADLCCGTALVNERSFQRSVGIFRSRQRSRVYVPCSTCRHWTSFGAERIQSLHVDRVGASTSVSESTPLEQHGAHRRTASTRMAASARNSLAKTAPHSCAAAYRRTGRDKKHMRAHRCESATRAGCLRATSHRLGLSMVRQATRWYLSDDLARAARL